MTIRDLLSEYFLFFFLFSYAYIFILTQKSFFGVDSWF